MAAAAVSTSTSNHFYLPIPKGIIWHTIPLPRWVIEAQSFTKDDQDLSLSERTDEFAQQYLKVINPAEHRATYIRKDELVDCWGPARKLGVKEYIALYHSINPVRELPVFFDKTINSTRRLRENELPAVLDPKKTKT